MKNTIITLLLTITTLLVFSQTSGTLTVEITTSETGGNYAPRNVVAIWIENENGDFVKTLLAYADNQKKHLNNWEASTGASGSIYNVVDAITGVTKTSHSTRTAFWDATGISGFLMSDGIYKVCMELTDKNSTGNYSSFEFNKGQDEVSLNPFNVPSFNAISIDWVPVISDINENIMEPFMIYPNPAKKNIHISGNDICKVEIYNSTGILAIESENTNLDISSLLPGVYTVLIKSSERMVLRKFIIN